MSNIWQVTQILQRQWIFSVLSFIGATRDDQPYLQNRLRMPDSSCKFRLDLRKIKQSPWKRVTSLILHTHTHKRIRKEGGGFPEWLTRWNIHQAIPTMKQSEVPALQLLFLIPWMVTSVIWGPEEWCRILSHYQWWSRIQLPIQSASIDGMEWDSILSFVSGSEMSWTSWIRNRL